MDIPAVREWLRNIWDRIGAPAGASIAADIAAIHDLVELTTFAQLTAVATNANGLNWVTLYNGSGIVVVHELCGFRVTIAGGWAGNCLIRIMEGTGTTKIFPFQDYYTENVEFVSGNQYIFNFKVVVPVASGFLFQFRSDNGADGAGQTCQLNNLDVIQRG